jgi:hypothetical protein
VTGSSAVTCAMVVKGHSPRPSTIGIHAGRQPRHAAGFVVYRDFMRPSGIKGARILSRQCSPENAAYRRRDKVRSDSKMPPCSPLPPPVPHMAIVCCAACNGCDWLLWLDRLQRWLGRPGVCAWHSPGAPCWVCWRC